MPAITVRNIPDDVHRAFKALAARNGQSAEAQLRSIIAAAVDPSGRLGMGDALAKIWGDIKLTSEEAEAINSMRDRTIAEPMSFDE